MIIWVEKHTIWRFKHGVLLITSYVNTFHDLENMYNSTWPNFSTKGSKVLFQIVIQRIMETDLM
jgi:hypothetical protein